MTVRHTRYGRLAGQLLALTFCSAFTAAPLKAQEYGIIDDVRIGASAQGPQIRISFTKPAQYRGHTPKEQSRQLFIDLRLVSPDSNQVQVPQPQQLRFEPTKEVPLRTVSYRAQGGKLARLELNFTTPVRYQVSPQNDYRGITVTLIGDKAPQALPESKQEPLASPEVEKRVDALMEEARKEVIDERNFKRAIYLYKKVLNLPPNSRSRLALELLGLSRERAGQFSEAKSVYTQYLKRYPGGEGSERVRQRLMSLQTATLKDKKELREARKEGEVEWETYGSLSQFYLRDVVSVDVESGTSTETAISAFSTDVDLVALRRGDDSNTRFRVTAGHYHDLEGDRDDDARVSSLYAEHHDRDIGWWARGGRQTSSRDGVLGRFDGLKLGYAPSKQIEATVVAGYPVENSRDSLDDSRTFTGVALNMGPFAENWEYTLYGIEQTVDTLVDRRAVGGEVRYFSPEMTVLSLADYDVFYEELNIGMVLANWTSKSGLTLNAGFDVRKLPILTTRNALAGQTVGTDGTAVEDIAQLRTLYSDDTIYDMAKARAGEIQTGTLGISRPVTERLRLAADLSYIHTSTVQPSYNVGGIWPTTDYGINMQAIGTGLLNGDDISSLGLRYSDGTTVTNTGIYASSRLQVGQRWRYYPRLRIDQRNWKLDDQSQVVIGPTVRVDYSWGNMTFEAELGGEWTNHKMPDTTETTRGTFGSLGYHYDF
mgnify:CR=1 FL=1